MRDNFSPISSYLTSQLDSTTKKQNGIYFTPQSVIKQAVTFIQLYAKRTGLELRTVLEPACGSCEFIRYLNTTLSGVTIQGVELNHTIFQAICGLSWEENGNSITLVEGDYLRYDNKCQYDLIIGNPPYYVLPKQEVDSVYYDYFTGRPNIFILFIVASLQKLKPAGILCFVLPKSFLNCYYYNKLREIIYNKYTILNIVDCSSEKYLETTQPTVIFTLQRCKGRNARFALRRGKQTLFNVPSAIRRLKELCNGANCLKAMGFKVSVGSVVWNQVKELLTEDPTNTRLIYSSDIVNNQLSMKQYSNPEKKNYIQAHGCSDLLLVVNRGYGKGAYKFTYCLIDREDDYLVENHLICITSRILLKREELREKYEHIIRSLAHPNTTEFLELCLGNNAVNTRELSEIIPIYNAN